MKGGVESLGQRLWIGVKEREIREQIASEWLAILLWTGNWEDRKERGKE